jgi:hypothetical protein
MVQVPRLSPTITYILSMNPTPDKRRTQINFEKLGSLNLFPQSAGPHRKTSENHSVFDRGAATVAATKIPHPPRRGAVDPATALKQFEFPGALKPRDQVYKSVKSGSPWEIHEKNYELRLGIDDLVTVGERNDLSSDLVIVRSFPAHDASKKLDMLQRIQHRNFVSVLDVFSSDESFHIVFEHMPISLIHFAGIPYYPNELRLASIIGQVRSGTRSFQKM